MTSNSTRTRFALVTARLVVLLIAVCMVLAVAPRLTDGFLPTAHAAANLTSSSVSEINNFLNNNSGEINILLSGNVDLNGGGVVIPSGRTVNFYMNGHSMTFSKSERNISAFYGITNNGTLNLYSGSVSVPNLVSGESVITINNSVTGMEAENNTTLVVGSELAAIKNTGTLFVSKSVKLNVNSVLKFNAEGDGAGRGIVSVGATGVYNSSDSATAVLDGVTVNCVADAYCVNANYYLWPGHTEQEAGAARALAYGVYGGTVSIKGAGAYNVTANIGATDDGNSVGGDLGRSSCVGIAYGVCSTQQITVTGSTFSYSAEITDEHKGLYYSTPRIFMGGIAYSTSEPIIIDGSVNTFSGSVDNISDHKDTNVTVFEAPVGKFTRLPISGYTIVNDASLRTDTVIDSRYYIVYDYYPNGTNSAGRFVDEADNGYNTSVSTTDGSHPTAIVRGAESGKYRVHVVYRYWTDNTKQSVDTSVIGTDGYVGYSYKPIGDSTNIVNSVLKLNGLSGTNQLIRTGSGSITYNSGGASKNDYYWKQFNIAYQAATGWFSDYDVTAANHRGTVFKDFVNGTNDSVPASGSAVYIFMDYYKVAPTEISAQVGTNNSAAVTYTGEAIKASTFNLKIRDSVYTTDYTSDYNIDLDDPGLIPVSYSWSGTELGGAAVSGNTSLPTNAGTYQVTLTVADSSTYDPNDCAPATHKNRLALSYTFSLTINPAQVVRGTLPDSVDLTYGKKLNEKLTLNSYGAKGVRNEAVQGSFSFANSTDGSSYKNVGTGNVTIIWTPANSEHNYAVTSFTVAYSVAKASLVISPNAAEVEYGDTSFATPYSISAVGLVGNDNNNDALSQIASAIDYMILLNGSYIYYNPDDVSVGSYDIRARVKQAQIPPVLNNYTYSYADLTPGYEVNQLTVTKRSLTVKATAVSRAYVPDNYNVDVTYEIVDGRYSQDDVRFTTGTGSINPCYAGTRTVGGVTSSAVANCMTGAKAGSYRIGSVVYDTGDTLTVEITKAIPDAVAPVVDDMYYNRGRKLSDISLSGSNTSVAGTWEWKYPNDNPTVAVGSYTAVFKPTDNTNYDNKEVEVAIRVNPTPVVITYNNTVEYGDPVPNITAYTYIAELDPTFSRDALETTGNITPHTEYTEGSAVSAEGYPVTITLQNYQDSAGNYTFTAQPGKIVVTPRNIAFTVQNVTIEYGENFTANENSVVLNYDPARLVGSDTLSSITDNGAAPTWNYSTTYTYQSNYQVGVYQLKADMAFNTSPNYTVSVVNGSLTVTKAPLTIRANSVTLPYNSDVPADLQTAYTLIGAKRGERISAILTSGEISVDTNYTKGAPVNSTGYNVSVNISNATFRNYTVTVEGGLITVVKATPVIRSYPTASIVYGQTLADAVFTGSVIDDDVPGTFAYNAATTKPAYSSTPYTNYTAAFIPTDTNNYNTVTGLAISLTVNKMPVTGNLSVTGLPMKGNTLTVDVSGMDPDTAGAYTFTWVMDESTVGTGETLALTEEHVGKAITVTAVAQGYYEGQRSYTVTAIAPELPSVATILNSTSYANYFDLAGLEVFGNTTTLTYDGGQHDVTLTQKTETLSNTIVGAITVKYNGSTVIPVNAGLYTVSVDVATPDLSRVNEAGVTTYSPATGLVIGTLKIDKAPYSVSVTIKNKVYDGYNTATADLIEESGAVMLAGSQKDDVAFDRDRAVYTFDNASVGTAKAVHYGNVALTGSAAENYELTFALANGGKADISKRTLNVTVDPVERKYEENFYDIDLSFIVDTSTIAPADTSDDVYVNEALAAGRVDDYHAGTRRVTVSGVELAGNKASNYELNLTNLTDLSVEILKATPGYPLPNVGTVYYDSSRRLSGISLGDSRWTWESASSNVTPEAGWHTYTAVYTPDDTDNFAAVNYDVTFEVKKAPVVIKADSFNVVYGDYAPTYSYKATGLTGLDSVSTLGGYVIMNCLYEPGSPVGQYSVFFSGGFSSNNYEFTYQPGTINVTPRPAYVTAIAESRPYEAGNTAVKVTFSELSNIYPGDAAYVYLDVEQPLTGSIVDASAGNKIVSYVEPGLGGSKAENYSLTFLNPELRVEITKAVLSGVVLPTSGTVKYGAKLSTTEFTSSYAGQELGTFSMENPMSTPAAVGTTSNAYKVVFTPNDTINYATISDYITLTVVTADLNVELILSGSAEVGKKLYVATNNLPSDAYDYIEFRWYRLNSRTGDVRDGTLVASDTTEYTVTERDADQYIVCVAVNKANSPYNISGRASSENTVSKKSMSLWERILKWFYKVIASITQLFGKI